MPLSEPDRGGSAGRGAFPPGERLCGEDDGCISSAEFAPVVAGDEDFAEVSVPAASPFCCMVPFPAVAVFVGIALLACPFPVAGAVPLVGAVLPGCDFLLFEPVGWGVWSVSDWGLPCNVSGTDGAVW